jgi:Fur family ferric uptake transcriptional regulator
MNETRPNGPLEEAAARIRASGLRVTRPRTLAYALLLEVGGHRSVDELVGLLAARDEPVSRMSVYNVVADLTRAGLLMCAEIGPGRALYEANDEWHHHFVCRRCYRVTDVHCITGSKPCIEPPADFPGTADEAQVTFRGICDDCAADAFPQRTNA